MAKSKKKKHEDEHRAEEDELEDEDELEEEGEYDDDEYDDDEYDDDEYEYEEEEEEEADLVDGFGAAEPPEDPFWWTPHAVLAAILVVSLLGFFGMFTPWVAPLMSHSDHGDHGDHGHGDSTSAPATPPPAPKPTEPAQRPKPQAPAQDVMGARHILVAYEGAMRARPQIKRTKDAAKKRAAEVAGKAKKLGGPNERLEDWKKLVEEYSDEPGAAKRGGDLGRFRAGSFHKDFVAGTEKLKVGEISGPVETPFGYHVIWRTF